MKGGLDKRGKLIHEKTNLGLQVILLLFFAPRLKPWAVAGVAVIMKCSNAEKEDHRVYAESYLNPA